MMNEPARRATMSCALLAATALGSTPAWSQAAQPSVYQHIDGNGVDLTDGSFNFALTEGTIGSGPGAIALVRYQGVAGESDSLSVRFSRTVASGTATIALIFGNRRETFSGPASATSFASSQGSGATLTRISASEYRYTAADGTVATYGPPHLLQDVTATGFCSTTNETACELIAVQAVRPNGATTTYQWDVGQNCTSGGMDQQGEPIWNCAQFWRQRGLSNNSGYRLRFFFQQEANPTSGAPGTAWRTRTGATLHNDAVAGSPVRTIAYANPGTGVTEITTDGGQTWRLTRDAQMYLVGLRRPGSAADDVTIAYTGPTTGVVSSVTADGVTTSYARSVTGSTATMTVTNALSQQTMIVSDLNVGRPTAVTDPLNRTTSVQYDSAGRPTRVTAPEGNYTQSTYDARGNVVQTQHIPKPGSAEPTITTSAAYAATCGNVVTCNLPVSTTDARGNVTDYTYDQAHGGALTVTAPAVTVGNAAVRPQVRMTYATMNGIQLPTQSSACQTGANCAGTSDEVRTSVTYGTNHLPVSISSGDGTGALTATRALTYDSAGDVLTVDGPLAGSADTDRNRYDAGRRLVGTVSPDPDGAGALPHRATRITYRPDGQVSRAEAGIVNSQSDADWAQMVVLEQVDTVYDANDRPAVRSHAAAGAMHNVVQTGYDALGRPECVAERMNPASWTSLPASACTPAATGAFGPDRIGRTARDAAGQVTEVRTAVGTPLEAVVAASTYGANGQTLTVTDGENNRTSYEYDGFGRLRRTLFPLAAQGANASNAADYEELGYDPAGNVVSRRNRAGETATYTIDALGRIILKDLPSTEPDVTYSYDLLGRLTSASQPGHVLGFTFDALGQLTQTNPIGTITSVWDLAGRRTRITYPGGYYVEHDYLATGEVAAIRENGATSGVSVIAVFGYDLLGRRTSLTRGNGVVTNYSYGPDTRLAQIAHNPPGTTNDLTRGFTYNPAGQILSNSRSNSLFSYTGPAAGTTNSTANGLNQLATHGAGTPTYDARGNLASEGGRSFLYSSENLLTGFVGHGRTMSWTWDPLMRVHHQVTSGANPRTYLFDGGNMILQNMNGAMLSRYVYGPGADEPIYSIDNQGRRAWFVADERGSILGEIDTAGTLGMPRTYDEYGNASSLSYQHGYAGTLYLGLSRLYYNRARIYDPTIGRFLQTDPIGYGDGMNMYAYVGGDPVNRVDPAGTVAVSCNTAATRIRTCDDGLDRNGKPLNHIGFSDDGESDEGGGSSDVVRQKVDGLSGNMQTLNYQRVGPRPQDHSHRDKSAPNGCTFTDRNRHTMRCGGGRCSHAVN
jgi:RHS repeat-associated protein